MKSKQTKESVFFVFMKFFNRILKSRQIGVIRDSRGVPVGTHNKKRWNILKNSTF
jgi:hypothetical protein